MSTVLIVDDEYGTAELLALILEEEGFKAHCAYDGQTGLKCVEEHRPGIIVLDVMLTGMSGVDLAKAVRSLPFGKDIQILMHSCLPETKVRETFDEYNGFMRKPISSDDLVRLIHQLMSEHPVPSRLGLER